MFGNGNESSNIDKIVVCYKVPKSLYFMISDKIEFKNFEKFDEKKILAPIVNYNTQTDKIKEYIKLINYEKLTEKTKGDPKKREEQLKIKKNNNNDNIILNECFYSSGLNRFNNKSFTKWGMAIDTKGKPKTQYKPTKQYEKVSNLLMNITKELKKNNNIIHKLYYFDLNIDIIVNQYEENKEYYKEIGIDYKEELKKFNIKLNSEIAKCLLHTFMHSFDSDFIKIDDIYKRFGEDEKLLKPFNDFYEIIKEIANKNNKNNNNDNDNNM